MRHHRRHTWELRSQYRQPQRDRDSSYRHFHQQPASFSLPSDLHLLRPSLHQPQLLLSHLSTASESSFWHHLRSSPSPYSPLPPSSSYPFATIFFLLSPSTSLLPDSPSFPSLFLTQHFWPLFPANHSHQASPFLPPFPHCNTKPPASRTSFFLLHFQRLLISFSTHSFWPPFAGNLCIPSEPCWPH